MIAEATQFTLWVNWDTHTASEKYVPGFEALTFYTLESYQSNIKLLRQSGFIFV